MGQILWFVATIIVASEASLEISNQTFVQDDQTASLKASSFQECRTKLLESEGYLGFEYKVY